ncbi:M91 family zinc metallopeptidase [Marinomonas lutimaris]|uniref:M91 family zinc metallopeptidase n=1 Tax=Marinomonas lutimaris TaxID=2846746 RepID=UPI001CA48451|nr:M91 family zinc metallopeptidase [Marinomonas lutimaris]
MTNSIAAQNHIAIDIPRDHIAIDIPRDHIAIDIPPSPQSVTPARTFPAQLPNASQDTLTKVGASDAHATNFNTITPAELQLQKSQLNKVTEQRSPLVNNLSIIRDGEYTNHKNGAEFTDFAIGVRQHLTELAEVPAGQRLLKTLDYTLNGTPSKHHVSIQDSGRQPGIREWATFDNITAAELQISKEGKAQPGKGSGSTISHHTDFAQHLLQENMGTRMPSQSDAIVLGHELIHAARAAQGLTASGVAKSGIDKEEVATVGKPDGSEPEWPITTENTLRHEMNERIFRHANSVNSMPIRTSYGDKQID